MTSLRALRLLIGLHLRAWLNQISNGQAWRSKDRHGPPAGRPASIRRRRLGAGVMIVLALPIFGGQIAFLSGRVLDHAWRHAEGLPALEHRTWRRLATVERKWNAWALTQGADPDARAAERRAQLMQMLEEDASRPVADDALLADALRALERHGGQTLGDPMALLDGGADARLAPVMAALLALAAGFVLTTALGLGNQDLGRVEPLQRWLATLPVSARVLAVGQLLGHLATSFAVWVVVPAMLIPIGFAGGWGWWSLPAAAIGTVAVGLMLAGARLAIEAWLRARLDHARRKNVQAACTIVGLGLMVAIYGVGFAPGLPGWFIAMAGPAWTWLPPAWPVVALLGGGWVWLAATVLVALAACAGALALAVRAGRGGLEDAPAAPSAPRGQRPGSWAPIAVFAKDLRLLARDRALLVTVLVAPLAMVALQLTMNQRHVVGMLSDFRHACTLAFVLGGYVLLNGAATILSAEGAGTWLLMGAPTPLRRLLGLKLRLWIAVALAYALVAVALAAAFTPWPGVAGLGRIAMVVAGVPIFAAIAAGLGAAATDPLASDPQRRLAPGSMWLYLLLLTGYAQAMYTAGPHGQLAYVMVTGVLAYGLWQRLDDRLPFLLDPGERPPRRLALSDGALAAMLFLVLQGVIAIPFALGGVALERVLVISFAGAGVVASLAAAAWLWREGVVHLPTALGLLPDGGRWPAAIARSLLGGAAAGGVALLAAMGWLRLVEVVPALEALRPTASALALTPMLVVLVVALAPLCEEFIFRGLLYGGLRRSVPGWLAVVASAAVFALIHPTASLVPVFGLGCAAALAYRWAGWLPAAMVAHAVYNAGIVIATR